MKIMSNNNSENNVMVSQGDKDQEDLTFLIIEPSGEGLSSNTGAVLLWCRRFSLIKLHHFPKKVTVHLFHRRFLQHALRLSFDPRNL